MSLTINYKGSAYFASNVYMRLILSFMLLIATFFAACKKPQAFDYRDIKNLRISNLRSDTSRISMDLVYFNPNNYGVTLKKVDCEIYIDSSYIGKFTLDTMMHIPRAAEFTLPASMDVNMKNILKNGLNLLFNNEILIGARGTSRVGKGGFYVTIPFNYEGKHKLNF